MTSTIVGAERHTGAIETETTESRGTAAPPGADDETLGLRPLTARSVIASTLLGTNPPVLPTRILVAAALLFGVSDSAARTALSRMVAAGDLVAGDGTYGLGPELVRRQGRQDSGRRAARRPWSGDWVLAVIPSGRRSAADRSRQRTELERARFGELREGVWLRPDNLEPPRLELDVRLGTYRPDDPVPLRGLWELDGWAATADGLAARAAALAPGLAAGRTDLLAPGFVISAAVLRLFQHDPLLPDELLPPDWPGERLRRGYDRFDAAYRALLLAWFRDQAPGGNRAR